MESITNFELVRLDGKIITESTSVDDMLAGGWLPCIIVRVQWDFEGRPICFETPGGALARLFCHRSLVAMIQDGELMIINSDGSVRSKIPRHQIIDGLTLSGEFKWFERPRISDFCGFGVIFEVTAAHQMFELEVDATKSAVSAVMRVG